MRWEVSYVCTVVCMPEGQLTCLVQDPTLLCLHVSCESDDAVDFFQPNLHSNRHMMTLQAGHAMLLQG